MTTVPDKPKEHLSYLPEYRTWYSIKRRCYSKKDLYYQGYGALGITVSDEWLKSFEAFYKDMGPKPKDKHSLDRRDKTGNFTKDNCYWATKKEKEHNRANGVLYTYQGKTQNLRQWCSELGLPYSTIYSRIYDGYSFEKSITTPVGKLNTTLYDYHGETLSLTSWSRKLGFNYRKIYNRILKGMTFEEAIKEN